MDDKTKTPSTNSQVEPDVVSNDPAVAVAQNHDTYISVRSLWKVFGKNPESALAPGYADQDRASIVEQLGCVVGLQDVNFDVNRGETFVVMGLSGSGKSTLVRCLIRLIEPTAGQIIIEGQDVSQFSESELIDFRRSTVAMVFQHYGLLPHRNVLDNAAWGLEIQGIDKDTRYSRTQKVLDLVGLTGWEKSYPRELSGGMQQRVGLARALAVHPDILLMDEPFSGLDPLIRRNMQDELMRLQAELHKTIIFITHDLTEALKLGDRISIMRDGRVVQIGTPEEIVFSPENEYVEDFTKDVRRESILTAARLMVPPSVVVAADQSADVALTSMNSSHSSFAFVIDADAKYIGSVSIDEVRRSASDNLVRLDESSGCIIDEVSTVKLETCCDELIPLTMTSEHPIPVLDEHGALVGEVHREAVAAAISVSSGPAIL